MLAVLFFGSKKLPEVARALGKAMGEFQRGRAEIERELKQAYEQTQDTAAKQTYEKVSTEPQQTTGEREKLERIARELNLPTVGKTNEELKADIQRALTKP